MYILAYASLLLALLISLGAGGMALLQLWQERDNYLPVIRNAHWLLCGAILLASALLLHALFWEDYRLEYVASYTDSILPIFYRLTAFWAGQPGSMLFWALCCALVGLFFMLGKAYKCLSPRCAMWFWTIFYMNMGFFCLVLTCWSNPFLILSPAPLDGQGLNPLLQNPGMIFHPPLLFLGYALFSVPACVALAQCLAPNSTNIKAFSWYKITRPYILLAWIFLSAGIILGAWWAYMELGWGGYWAWDPVENASLLPWLIASACLHILAIENASGKLARVSSALMAFSVISAFFATYLTRSGVIQSVHAFGDGGVGTPLLLFILAFSIFALWAVFSAPRTGKSLAQPLSREGALVLCAWIFLAMTVIIALATIWPVITRFVLSKSMGLEASFYNRVCLPLGAGLLLLLCICTWLGWNGGLLSLKKFYATCAAFIISLAAIWLAGYRQPLTLITAACSIAALCTICLHLCRVTSWRQTWRLSAYGAHLGMALLAIGVAFSAAYTTDKEMLLSRGQSEKIGSYTVTLSAVSDGSNPGYDYLRASLKISSEGKELGELNPERRIYAKFGDMQFSEVDVISSLSQDIYASLLGMDEDYKVLVKISLEPLVNWIWIGGALLCLLPLFGIWGKRNNALSGGNAENG